ncbi:MAG: hypothetical protein IJM32_10910 [Ruminococcus sp.]|nr:hypothetical protein [Ruminococcus sp.]
MSERTVSQNNKLWETAEKIAQQVVAEKKAESEEERRKQKKRVIKLLLLLVLIALIIVFASIAWFTMNRETGMSGMGVKTAPLPFELKTSGSAGLYDDLFTQLGPDYANAETTATSQGIRWRLTKNTSELNNLYSGTDEPDLEKITSLDSDQYGLKPGDSGTLKFSIVPRDDAELDLHVGFSMKGYSATFDANNNKTDDDLVLVTDTSVLGYLNSHIIFFYKDAEDVMHVLPSDGFDISVDEETEVTLYWAWPATLKEIEDANINGINSANASTEVRRLFFISPGNYLKATGTENFSTITVTDNADKTVVDNAITEKLPLVTGRHYDHYAAMYNEADQTIGSYVNYILVEVNVDLQNN